jgi:hypothetical protein
MKHRRRLLQRIAVASALIALASLGSANVASATSDTFGSGVVPCDGSYHNYTTTRSTAGSSDPVSLQMSYNFDCVPAGAAHGFHANSCSNFTSIGSEVVLSASLWGYTSSGNMPKSQQCWRYSIRQAAGNSSSGSSGQFSGTEAY